MASLQTLVNGVTLLFIYRYLLHKIGPELFGVLTIVLATASATKISEMGFSGSAIKFTAKYVGRGDRAKASEVVQTTAITIGLFVAAVLAICYPIASRVLARSIPSAQLPIALAILPYSILSVWIGALSGVFSAGLEGCQRIDLRAWISMFSAIFFCLLTWLLVPNLGLIGVAWAQIGQGLVMLTACRLFLQRELPGLPFLPTGWRYSMFREMLHYGANFQVGSICGMITEPATKLLMAKFGGLELAAYYDTATRMVSQMRLLLITAHQAIVPRVATLIEKEPHRVEGVYLETFKIVAFLGLPFYSAIANMAPLLGLLLIGHYEPTFVKYARLLALVFWVNNLCNAAYFMNLGTGRLKWNTVSHIVIAVLNLTLGYSLGVSLGGDGVVLGYSIAFIIGSCFVPFGYHREHRLSFSTLLPRDGYHTLWLALACIGGSFACYGIDSSSIPHVNLLAQTALGFAVSLVIMAPFCWIHPERSSLLGRLQRVKTSKVAILEPQVAEITAV